VIGVAVRGIPKCYFKGCGKPEGSNLNDSEVMKTASNERLLAIGLDNDEE